MSRPADAVIHVRREEPRDRGAVRRVNLLAFGQATEADLVDAVRGRPGVLSLVAADGEEVAGHILFAPVRIEGVGRERVAVGLGPMAVVPDRQRQGIGSQLVRAGLAECGARGDAVVVVVGHPRYYPRFGFVAAGSRGLRCPWPVPDDVFMALELRPGALEGISGVVRYLPEFEGV